MKNKTNILLDLYRGLKVMFDPAQEGTPYDRKIVKQNQQEYRLFTSNKRFAKSDLALE